jgi:hypothetical protein
MKSKISRIIYYLIAAILIIFGTVTKYFLIDTNIGERSKNFYGELFISDLIFTMALFFALIGFIFQMIRKSKKATLNDFRVLVSAALIFPFNLTIVLVPFLMTYFPEKTHDDSWSWIVSTIAILGTFGAIFWIILFIFTSLEQAFIILISKKNKN